LANSVILTKDELYTRILAGTCQTEFQVFNKKSIVHLLCEVMEWNDNEAREITDEDIMTMEDKIITEIESLIGAILPS
jgi:hypothetical protein